MTAFSPSSPFTVPMTVLTPSTTRVNGVVVKGFADGRQFFGSFRTFGGTEREQDGLTVGEIGERLMLDNGTLTPMLKKLEAAGYIDRVRSRRDERVVEIHLTKKGRDLREKALEIPMLMGQCVALDREEAATLKKLLDKILA